VDLYDELLTIAEALDSAAIPYALCGGLALAVHGVPRATVDIDLLIRRADLARLRELARAAGFTVETELRFAGGLEIFRSAKIAGDETLVLDLLALRPGEEVVWESRQCVDVGGRPLWVVSLDGLKRLKLAAGRDQDLADLRRLAELDG
jgi:hypothetical protein